MSAGNMERVLRLMSEKGASDVYLSASSPILIKINGQLLQLSDQPLTSTQPRQLLAELLTPSQLEELEDTGELNVGVGLQGVGSFRLSGFKQRGTIAAVFRCIPFEIPSLESLNVPSILSTLVLEKRGLILMVGATGAGKSTTLASMLEQRNQQGCKGKTEASFLDVLDETVAAGKTAAENLLDLYQGAWNGNIERVFRDFAY